MRAIKVIIAVYIVRTLCWDGIVYHVWSDGRTRYWLPKLTKTGEVIRCGCKIKTR